MSSLKPASACDMALPLSSEASTRSGPRGLRTQVTSFFDNDRGPVPPSASPSLDEHPALRKKGGRFGIWFFGSGEADGTLAEGAVTPPQGEREATYSAISVGTNNSVSQSVDTLPLSRQSRRTQYTEAWVRRPRRKRGSSNKVTASYRAALRNRMVRRHLITCIISGILLLAVITIYLGFVVASDSLEQQYFHVLLILLIMIFAMFFCHSLARTCLLATRVARYGSAFHRVPSVVGPLGYAQPEQPIHVVLARDEEIAIENRVSSEMKVVAPPPAYGLWRSSVKINPNLIYWQRARPNTSKENDVEPPRTTTAIRPPSYASDNGVDYVIQAQPRSTVSNSILPEAGQPSTL